MIVDPDFYFIEFMKGMLGEALENMTAEQAQIEANADYRTERQFEAMGGAHERL